MRPPKIYDIFRFGLVFENLAAKATGAGNSPDYDAHQLADMRIHLQTWVEHEEGRKTAMARGDPVNAFIEFADGAVNALFAWIVASRILDPVARKAAFEELNTTLSGGLPGG